MAHYGSPEQSSNRGRRAARPRTTLRVRNVAAGVMYHLVFEGDLQRLSGKQLRHHLARISHIPPTEQQLFVHGQAFSPAVVGGAVGLREEDVVDLVQTAENVQDDQGRGGCDGSNSMATASSPPPSTDAGTLSPKLPWQSRSGSGGVSGMRRMCGTYSASASRASTASASTRRAPSPDRLVNASSFAASGFRGQTTTGDDIACKQRTEPLRQQRHPAPLNDSSLPLWTSATTLSSLPSGKWPDGCSGDVESPRPQTPAQRSSRRAQGCVHAASPPYAYPQSSPQPTELLARPSASQPDLRRQWSYEVASPPPLMPQRSHVPLASPSPLNAPPPLTSRPGPANYCGAHAEPAAGLNYSHYDDHRSVFRDQTSFDPSPSQRAPNQQQVYRPRAVSPGPHDGSAPRVSAPVARSAVIRADELETILDEQNYIWQMEEYRFRTERQKRLTALQHRQHELTLESARYDQAVAEVERQLARERQRLEELQQVMAHNATTSCSLIDREHSLQDPPTAMSDAPHAITRNSPVMHHGRARDHAYSAPHDAQYFPTGASDGVSAMNEEEVIAEV